MSRQLHRLPLICSGTRISMSFASRRSMWPLVSPKSTRPALPISALTASFAVLWPSLVEQLDTTAFNAQLEAWMAQYQAETGERLELMAPDMEGWFAG